ncbi:hypothetical protein KM043_015336 [Ampulex compressa]|nr:hypothetical protein KM043_015336 [Ampulex compressa]
MAAALIRGQEEGEIDSSGSESVTFVTPDTSGDELHLISGATLILNTHATRPAELLAGTSALSAFLGSCINIRKVTSTAVAASRPTGEPGTPLFSPQALHERAGQRSLGQPGEK